MSPIVIAGILVLTLLACRYVPGIKCISYCRVRQLMHKWAVKKINNMGNVSAVTLNTYSTKSLIRIHKYSNTNTCYSLSNYSHIEEARKKIEDTIAERQLLDIQ